MFGLFNKQKGKPGLLGVSFVDDELALAHMTPGPNGPELGVCEAMSVENLGAAGRALAGVVAREHLENVRCNFILSPDDYNLLLIEAPAVEKHELASAAKWKIKDMIDRPIDQIAVVAFPVPGDAYRNQRNLLYVVAADKKRIQQVVGIVQEAGLRLEAIDIPELAMLNLSNRCLDDGNAVAMLDLRHSGSLLNLCKGNAIYLTRHLNTQMGEEVMGTYEWDNVRERLVLEVQRSLDYYESQMGQAHISRLVLAPRRKDASALVTQLNEAMGVRVEVMDLEKELASDGYLPPNLQQSCMFAIGGALRPEGAAA